MKNLQKSFFYSLLIINLFNNCLKANNQELNNTDFSQSPYLEVPLNNNINNNINTNNYNIKPLEPLNNNINTNNINTSDTNNISPIKKVGDWVNSKRKYNQTGKPEVDLANQRIKAGKARLKAVKAKEKLDKYIMQSQEEIQKLTKEAKASEEEASLMENQIRFQESNKN